jgi:hypothetical protein
VNRLRIVLTLAGLAMLMPAVVFAATVVPGAGIAGTVHDFSGRPVPGETFTTGLCTFCHTPHRALQTSLLWNHTLSAATYSWTDATSTIAGTKFPTIEGLTYKGPTAKCLSCHDGSVAIGDVAWFGEKPRTGADALDTTKHTFDPTGGVNVGATGGVLGSMNGNHPVAMPYPFQRVQNTYNGQQTGGAFTPAEWQTIPFSPIRVFNDDGAGNITAGAVALKTGIECSSCHDPHNRAAVDDLFLRGTIGGNTAGAGTTYICLKCHIK